MKIAYSFDSQALPKTNSFSHRPSLFSLQSYLMTLQNNGIAQKIFSHIASVSHQLSTYLQFRSEQYNSL